MRCTGRARKNAYGFCYDLLCRKKRKGRRVGRGTRVQGGRKRNEFLQTGEKGKRGPYLYKGRDEEPEWRKPKGKRMAKGKWAMRKNGNEEKGKDCCRNGSRQVALHKYPPGPRGNKDRSTT